MGYQKAKIELMVTFLDALGPGWIKIMMPLDGSPESRLHLGSGADVEVEHATLCMFDTIWFSKKSHADLVFEQCLTVLGVEPEATIAAPAGEVRDCIVNVSADLGAAWQSTAEVVADAEREVEEIERQIEALNKSGGLQPLNKKYKSYRLAMQKTGEAATSYSAYLQIFRLKVAKMIGENVASGASKYAGFSMIAPSLMATADAAVRALPVMRNTAPPRVDRLDAIPQNSVRRHNGKMKMMKVW